MLPRHNEIIFFLINDLFSLYFEEKRSELTLLRAIVAKKS